MSNLLTKRIASLKTVAEFRIYAESLGIDLPCADHMIVGEKSPLLQKAPFACSNGKSPGNRWAIQPMEGWDGTREGAVTADVLRRWGRFGDSGAKLIWGEAMAICAGGRANPNQIILREENLDGLKRLRMVLEEFHLRNFNRVDDLVMGFQLTHSGRFSRPLDKNRLEPRVAYRHPYLDEKFGITSDSAILRDDEIPALIEDYVNAALLAKVAGADFIDLKHCHGYLLHEFLSARSRSGPYGGSLCNRTRLLREIVAAIRASGNLIDIAVRISVFDFVPYRPDPAGANGKTLAVGQPEPVIWPYPFAFGASQTQAGVIDLTEPMEFLKTCHGLGIRLINLTAGSPYYNPHIQRPAAYPPSDGYAPPNDPLIDVARQIRVVRDVKAAAPPEMVFVGTAYSYLQEYLPLVAQEAVVKGWTDMVGLGRMALSYSRCIADAVEGRTLESKLICRTLSDCTTAPRKGLPSGCYPLDPYYATKPEAGQLKKLKRNGSTK